MVHVQRGVLVHVRDVYVVNRQHQSPNRPDGRVKVSSVSDFYAQSRSNFFQVLR